MKNNFFLGALPTISTDDVPTYSPTGDGALPSPAYNDAGASGGSPVPSDVVTDKPADVGGGSEQKSDPNTPKGEDEKDGEDNNAGDMLKISAPILLLGAAAAFYFFYLRKKK